MADIDIQAQIDASWATAGTMIESRTVLLNAPIEPDTTNRLIGHLLLLARLSHKPIVLRLRSGGGQVYGGLAIHDAMQHVTAPIITVADTICGGMALLLLMSGTRRYALTNSKLEYTPLQAPFTDLTSDVVIGVREADRLNGILAGIVRRHTFQPNPIRRFFAGDDPPWDLNALYTFSLEEALRYQIIDAVFDSADDIPR